jgi:hypothetical protein
MRRLRIAAAFVAGGVALAACASTTNGTGAGSARPTPSTTTITPPSSAPPSTVSLPPSSVVASTGTAPAPVDPPAVCAGDGCTELKSADLGDGYTATLYSGSSAGGSVASTVLELSDGGVSVFWHVTDEQVAGDLVCSPQPEPNCVVVAGLGAHASVATGYTRRLNALAKYDDVESDTPSTDPVDLNGDGLVDVVTAINTYEPSYATGTVYWQTFQSTGTAFHSTGCTPPQQVLAPEPTGLLTGACP